jgi:hypothetical protein
VVSGSEERKEYYPAQVPPPQLPKIKKDVVLVSSLRSRSPPLSSRSSPGLLVLTKINKTKRKGRPGE